MVVRFGGEEGLEDVFDYFGWYVYVCVGDGEDEVVVGGRLVVFLFLCFVECDVFGGDG